MMKSEASFPSHGILSVPAEAVVYLGECWAGVGVVCACSKRLVRAESCLNSSGREGVADEPMRGISCLRYIQNMRRDTGQPTHRRLLMIDGVDRPHDSVLARRASECR